MNGDRALDDVRDRLSERQPQRILEERVARAAVAMVLHASRDDAQLLLIQRAHRDGDPWSGHMALPGGRRDPGDVDLIQTAIRETWEEVGIDLAADAAVIGELDQLRAVARFRPLDLVISPYVFRLRRSVSLTLNAREVRSAVWVPLSFFRTPVAAGRYRRELEGIATEFPCYRYQGYTIWGLTHRILEGFLAIVASPEES
jgi:8-oxo-dGTP pyrophosphatase MutT (NUDIX family)